MFQYIKYTRLDTLSITHTLCSASSGMLSACIFIVIITWQSLSLWVVSTHDCWEERAWAPSDNLQWLNEHIWLVSAHSVDRHTGMRMNSEDTMSTRAMLDSLWCPSVIVHIKVIKRVQVKNDDACSVFISWRWILQSVLTWMDGLWVVHAALSLSHYHLVLLQEIPIFWFK